MRNDFQEGAFLAHSAKGTTWKKGTSYIKKIPLGGGKFHYVYSQAELNAIGKKNAGAENVLSNKERQKRLSEATKAVTVEDLAKNGFKVSGKTSSEKAKNLKSSISKGEQKIQEALSKSKKSGSGSGSGGSSGSKKSSGGSGSKGSSGSGKEKAAKEKSGAAKKEPKEKTSTKETKKKEQNNTPINLDSLKKIYGAKDEDVEKHDMSASEFKSKMLSKYKEGSFGYLMAGGKAYKWTIDGGQLVLKDFNSDKDVSFDTYLKNVKSFEEFQTNKKKKK